jgi:hypothetical protein
MNITPHPFLATYYSIAITITLPLPLPTLTVINFYHHVTQNQPRLEALLKTSIPCDAATIVCGDFNTHSSIWSPGDIRPSTWAPSLEDWTEEENLVSLVPEGVITRRRGSDKPSVIDHIFANPAFLEVPPFPSECSVSFDLSLGSDHVGLLLPLPLHIPSSPPTDRSGWRVDDKKKANWISAFSALALNPKHITDDVSLKECTSALQEAITEVSNSLFPQPCPSARGLPWWNDHCKLAIAGLHGLHGDECRTAYLVLRNTIHRAKRDWFKTLLEDPEVNIWDLAKWRKGRRQKWLPPIEVGDGPSSEPGRMA